LKKVKKKTLTLLTSEGTLAWSHEKLDWLAGGENQKEGERVSPKLMTGATGGPILEDFASTPWWGKAIWWYIAKKEPEESRSSSAC